MTGLQGWLYPAISKKIFFSAWKIVGFRCVYRTLSNIYDGTFFKRMPCTILWFVSGSRKTRYNLWLVSYWNQTGIWLPYFLWCFDFIVKFQYTIIPPPPKKKKKNHAFSVLIIVLNMSYVHFFLLHVAVPFPKSSW